MSCTNDILINRWGMADCCTTKIEASRSVYYSLTDDVPGLTEEEKEKLEAVMRKAQVYYLECI